MHSCIPAARLFCRPFFRPVVLPFVAGDAANVTVGITCAVGVTVLYDVWATRAARAVAGEAETRVRVEHFVGATGCECHGVKVVGCAHAHCSNADVVGLEGQSDT